jgi:sucrose-6-phosphate hydrolase SacC (GH32 family)
MAVAACVGGQEKPNSSDYEQPYRPQVHFSPREHWTNDPNGLVYFDGEYHLFYQYNPFGDVWGHMSWGHAVSRDLLEWRELPVALPEENGIMIFTGSTVVDERNTSGFCVNGKPCMVAVYTGHTPETASHAALQTQNLAYSNDRGRTWTKYPGNPVLNLNLADFRDPHVFWSEQAQRWVMAVTLPNDHKVLFYGSSNLKQWTRLSEFGPAGATDGQWECPIMIELHLDGDAHRTRWLLKVGLNPGGLQGGSGEQYFVGTFDGARFVNENPASTTLWTDYGKDCYCALPFNGMRRGDAPVMIGWMNNWQYAAMLPTHPWRGQMTIPRRLALRTLPEGIRLVQEPVEALGELREKHLAWDGKSVDAALTRSFELHSETALTSAEEAGWKLLSDGPVYTLVGYNRTRGEIFVDRTHSGVTDFSRDFPVRTAAPLKIGNAPLRLTILVDRSTVEVFAQGGQVAITNLVYPPADAQSIEFYSRGGKVRHIGVDAWSLRSTWTQ